VARRFSGVGRASPAGATAMRHLFLCQYAALRRKKMAEINHQLIEERWLLLVDAILKPNGVGKDSAIYIQMHRAFYSGCLFVFHTIQEIVHGSWSEEDAGKQFDAMESELVRFYEEIVEVKKNDA
jgi:hypothetical protein